MNGCIELIFDYFGIEFYRPSGVSFSDPMMLKKKFLSASDISIQPSDRYLAVGNFDGHSGIYIQSNDRQDEITTKVSEKKNGEQYTVSVHFEFVRPTQEAVRLCEGLDEAPYHIVLNQLGFTGAVASRRVIRCETGQSRAEVTEEKGTVKVDVTVQNVNGIQLIG